jgi:hypothetical protein
MNENNKKKIIYIGIIVGVLIGGFVLIQLLNSDESEEQSDEITTPDKERDAYNSRTEAMNSDGKTVNLGDFNEKFNPKNDNEIQTPSPSQRNSSNSNDDSGLFADIDKQIANMQGTRQEPERTPTPAKLESQNQTVSVSSGSVSGGGVSSTPVKKSRKELRNDRLQEEAKQAIARGDYNNPVIVSAKASQQALNKNDNTDFSEVDKYVPASASTPPARIDIKSGKPQKFSDLPATEQRRILLQTGQSQYKESEYIQAKIISTGKIKAGQTIYLMLQEDAVLSFRKVPRGTRIGGIVRMNDNRMVVQFSSINLKGEILDVTLDLYGTDGILGLPVSGEDVTRDAKDEGIDEAISRTGRVGRVVGSITKSLQRTKDNSVDLGNNISCILRNRHKQE